MAARSDLFSVEPRPDRYQDLLHNIWLYIDWRYVTKQLTLEQKELFLAALKACTDREDDWDERDFYETWAWWR